MLNNLEKIRVYRAIVNAMKEEEKDNKKKSVLNARELLDLSFKRYVEMINILEPLKKSLEKEINITNIYFANDFQGNTSIVIEYFDDEGKKFFTIAEYDDNMIDILFDIYNGNYKKMLDDNKEIINAAFKANKEFSFEQEMTIPSTSKMFVIKEGCNYYGISDYTGKRLRMSYNYSGMENGKMRILPSGTFSEFKIVSELLANDVNAHNLLENIKVYEENVPKYLLKQRH